MTVTVTVNGQSGSLSERIYLQRHGDDQFRAGSGGDAAIIDGDGARELIRERRPRGT